MPHKDYYRVLGVGRNASEKEIKRAYRELSKKHHPDRNPDNPSSEEQFKEVQEAYSILKDPSKRAQYDEFGDVAVGNFHTAPGGQRTYQWGGGSEVNVDDLEDLFSAFGSGCGGAGGGAASPRPNVFNQFFGRGRPPAQGRPKPQPQRGADEEKTLNLTFMQAVEGATVTVRLRSGHNGQSKETLDVKIPPGVEDGQRIRLPGRAHPGTAGGSRGDLYLKCSVGSHEYFTSLGADIYLDMPVTVTEAVLGAKIEVPSLDGMATVALPPGTASGSKLRLKNRGINRTGSDERGHLYVVVKIVPPASLTEEDRGLYEKLAEHESQSPREDLSW